MDYLYYPGCCCAFKASGKAYEESLLAVLKRIGVGWKELQDWNCCGATMYMSIDEMQAFAMASRDFALAEKQVPQGEPHLMAPCAACYAVFKKTQDYITKYPQVGDPIRKALSANGLGLEGRVKVRHPLDIIVNDVGLETIKRYVTRPLKGLKVASYYGCLLLRPYASFDDPHHPQTMDRLVEALGGEPVEWPLKTRCCGGSLTGTVESVGLRLSYILLTEAQRRNADVVITACPFCETNLEAFQYRIHRLAKGRMAEIPVIYFTQLIGMAMGISDRELGLHRLFIPFTYKPKAEITERVAI